MNTKCEFAAVKNGIAYQYVGPDGSFYAVTHGGHHHKLLASLNNVPIRNFPKTES